MKIRKLSVPKALSRVESLEVRRFLSASVIGAIPTQNLTTGQSAPAVTLGSYFRDTVVPAGDSVVEIKTNLPAPNDVIPIELTDTATPQTVANFLRYITSGEFANSIFHRTATGFALQGGQYYADGSSVTSLGAIPSEASTATLHNTVGTLSAVLTSGPDSATDGFFFNLANNDGSGTTPNLDDTSDGGPFTPFGKVIYNGLSVVNNIAALPVVDASSINFAWNTLPVLDASAGTFGPPSSSPQQGNSGTVPTNGNIGTIYYAGQVVNLANGDVTTVSPSDTVNDVLVSEPASNLVVINPQILPGGLTYAVTSQNSNVASASIVNGQLLLTAGSAAGSTKITVIATDLGGGTATSTFTVKVGSAAASTGSITPAIAGSTPASIISGASLALKEKLIFKAGSSGFTGDASGAVLLSTTGNAADSVATLAAGSAKLKLNANQSKTLSLTPTKSAPANLASGTYHILVQSIDSSGTITVDTGKTITVKSPAVDLTGAFGRIPSSAKAGATARLTFTISNAATANITASGMLPYQIETSPDGKLTDATVLVSSKTKIGLKPGQRTNLTVPVKFKTTGSQFLIVVLDPGAAVFSDDANVANNTFVATLATTVA